DVVTVGRVLALDPFLRPAKQIEDRGLLVPGHLEEARDVAPGDHQDVPTAERVVVESRIGKLVLQHRGARDAELALPLSHSTGPRPASADISRCRKSRTRSNRLCSDEVASYSPCIRRRRRTRPSAFLPWTCARTSGT